VTAGSAATFRILTANRQGATLHPPFGDVSPVKLSEWLLLGGFLLFILPLDLLLLRFLHLHPHLHLHSNPHPFM